MKKGKPQPWELRECGRVSRRQTCPKAIESFLDSRWPKRAQRSVGNETCRRRGSARPAFGQQEVDDVHDRCSKVRVCETRAETIHAWRCPTAAGAPAPRQHRRLG